MMKRDPNGKYMYRDVGIFHKKRLYRFYSGKYHTEGEIDEGQIRAIAEQQQSQPVVVMQEASGKKKWWWYMDEVYWEDDGYTAEEIRALIIDKRQQKDNRVRRAMARIGQNDSTTSTLRESIPDDVKQLVWQRDGGRCSNCGSQQRLEFDHIIPVAKGGSNTARNIQLLCETCNRTKGANLA
jgi:hypothetical protein